MLVGALVVAHADQVLRQLQVAVGAVAGLHLGQAVRVELVLGEHLRDRHLHGLAPADVGLGDADLQALVLHDQHRPVGRHDLAQRLHRHARGRVGHEVGLHGDLLLDVADEVELALDAVGAARGQVVPAQVEHAAVVEAAHAQTLAVGIVHAG